LLNIAKAFGEIINIAGIDFPYLGFSDFPLWFSPQLGLPLEGLAAMAFELIISPFSPPSGFSFLL